MLLGIRPHLIFDILALSNMSGPLQRADSIYRLLAHLLSRMLAALPWLNQVVPHLQAHNCGGRSEASVLVGAYLQHNRYPRGYFIFIYCIYSCFTIFCI